MKYFSHIAAVMITAMMLTAVGCQKTYELGELTTPTNLKLTYEIVGADEENPNGDGSGLVNFTATADHAITFNFDFGDGKDSEMAPDGKITHQFTSTGLNNYDVKVSAVGTGGMSTATTAKLEVFSNFSDEEAIAFLTGGGTKSWFWAADQRGHAGLGPNDQPYDNGEHTFDAWWSAGAWEKQETTLYQCEFIFKLDGNKVTFEQLNPTGTAFIQGIYSEQLGLGPEGSYPWPIDGIKTVTFSPSSSIATIDGGYRGTSFNISDEGFMGWYVGSSEYEIIEITENILKVRIEQANEPLFAWYHIFTTEKPQ